MSVDSVEKRLAMLDFCFIPPTFVPSPVISDTEGHRLALLGLYNGLGAVAPPPPSATRSHKVSISLGLEIG